MATFSLTFRPFGPHIAFAAGSLILPWIAGPDIWQGTWTYGTDWYDCTFRRNFATDEVFALANWNVSGNLDTGQYPTLVLPAAPMPAYIVATLVFFDPTWLVKLTITG